MTVKNVNDTWSRDIPPRFAYLEAKGLTPVRTTQGWVHPTTGELLVSIRNLENRGDEADATGVPEIVNLDWTTTDTTSGSNFDVVVQFNENVTVTGTPYLVMTSTYHNISGDDGTSADTTLGYDFAETVAYNVTLGETLADSSTVNAATSVVNAIVFSNDALDGLPTSQDAEFTSFSINLNGGTIISYDAGSDHTLDATLTIPSITQNIADYPITFI